MLAIVRLLLATHFSFSKFSRCNQGSSARRDTAVFGLGVRVARIHSRGSDGEAAHSRVDSARSADGSPRKFDGGLRQSHKNI